MPDYLDRSSKEPDTLWEERYQTCDTPWEKGYAAPPLIELLVRHKVSGHVLVPGCGYGHDVRLLAQHGAQPTGLDIAPYAIQKAKSFSLINEEKYEEGDFFSLNDLLKGKFDWVFEHTFLCAINPSLRSDYVRIIHQTLKATGHLAVIFFIHIEDPEGPPFPISSEEIDHLFHPYFDTLDKWVPQKAYPGRENREQARIMRRKDHQIKKH